METAIVVGVSKESVGEARRGILDILGLNRSDHVTALALEVFCKVCEVRDTTIQHCTFGDLKNPEQQFIKEEDR